jgi:hypothetical protein
MKLDLFFEIIDKVLIMAAKVQKIAGHLRQYLRVVVYLQKILRNQPDEET